MLRMMQVPPVAGKVRTHGCLILYISILGSLWKEAIPKSKETQQWSSFKGLRYSFPLVPSFQSGYINPYHHSETYCMIFIQVRRLVNVSGCFCGIGNPPKKLLLNSGRFWKGLPSPFTCPKSLEHDNLKLLERKFLPSIAKDFDFTWLL